MANTTNPCARFKESTEVLPPKDPRAAAIADLEAKCRKCCEKANAVRDAQSAMFAAERELRAARSDDKTFEAALSVFTAASVRFGVVRDELYTIKDGIEADLHRYNNELGYNIFVSHTAAGLPIRVNHTVKKELWD